MRHPLARLAALFILFAASSPVSAQCPNWLAGPLVNSTPVATDGVIHATTEWDPDGNGPLSPRLVVGGEFQSIYGTPAHNVAMYVPETQTWVNLGPGMPRVRALIVFQGNLILGCDGDNNPATFDQTVRQWNGTNWVGLSATNVGDVHALGVLEQNGTLFAGGSFWTNFTTSAGPAQNLARWNPIEGAWDVVGSATPTKPVHEVNVRVLSYSPISWTLEVGGYKDTSTVGGFSTLVRQGWINSGTNSPEYRDRGLSDPGWITAIYRADWYNIYVGGAFSTIRGVPCSNFALTQAVTTSVDDLGLDLNGAVYSIRGTDLGVTVGGSFSLANGLIVGGLIYGPLLGSTWYDLNFGTNGVVRSVFQHQSRPLVAGDFTSAGAQAVDRLAYWDGTDWAPLAGGSGFDVLAMTTFRGSTVAGGRFHRAIVPWQALHNVARWDGQSLSSLGMGPNGRVRALKGFQYPGHSGDHELIAGGDFSLANGQTVNRIARRIEPLILPITDWAGECLAIERPRHFSSIDRSFGSQPLRRRGRVVAAKRAGEHPRRIAHRGGRWAEPQRHIRSRGASCGGMGCGGAQSERTSRHSGGRVHDSRNTGAPGHIANVEW